MKRKVVYLSIGCFALALLLTGALLKEFDGRFNTTVTFSADDAAYQLRAKYPLAQSVEILRHLNIWADQAAFQSGKLEDQLQLKFSDGSNCVVYCKGRKIQITAATIKNNPAQLARLTADYRAISAFIVKKTSAKK